MRLYSENENYKLYHGNMLDIVEVIKPLSIDAVVTDPPYELNFMNKGWDNSGIAFQKSTWEKCFEVLKPGGYLLAFGGSRTFHRIAVAIEDAGFEIRDTIMWLYGSGFPKSMNIGLAIDKKNGIDNRTGETVKGVGSANTNSMHEFSTEYDERIAQNEWNGWGTALKPSYEPVIVARKPCEHSVIDNVLKYGVGGINIDGCRIETAEDISIHSSGKRGIYGENSYFESKTKAETHTTDAQQSGRFPANTILTYDDTDFDEVCGGMPEGTKNGSINKPYKMNNSVYGEYGYCKEFTAYDDEGSAARYFYCAKADKRDRDEGLKEFEEKRKLGYGYDKGYLNAGEGMFKERQTTKRNTHPTVKPVSLMQYLVRLVAPPHAVILDPFNGSGSTGKAVMYENKDRNADYKYIGIELTEEYLPISKARIEYAINDKSISEEQKQYIEEGQMSLF